MDFAESLTPEEAERALARLEEVRRQRVAARYEHLKTLRGGELIEETLRLPSGMDA
jgi:hypothetical protein